MNERIRQLAEQAGKTHAESFRWEYMNEIDKDIFKTFAELIVRETVKEMSQQLYWHRMEQSNNPAYYKAIKKTLEHFGVEE